MQRTWISAAFLVILTAAARAGDISGKVTLESTPGARKVGETRASAGYEKGDVPPPSESEVEDVVIYLEGEKLDCTALVKMSGKNTILQKNKEFVPHVLPITKGSKVYFRNQDPFPHHVYSVSQPGSFEIVKHGSTVRSQEFGNPGEVEIFCGIHTKMNAYIMVLDNDFYSVVNRSGNYRISGVPAGQYSLYVWHPRLPKPAKRSISVPATGTVNLDLKL
ncbi:MAG: carboxypeptidase regulatory-like domain-containing protein [Vulcanimicrobiota bacterium]